MGDTEVRPDARSAIGTRELAVDAVDLRKVFGPTTALAGASFQVRPGEIHGLLGENGAGKSTLVKILAGLYEPDGGRLRFFGADATGGPGERRRAGLAFIHQDLGLFDEFSVAENIALSSGFRRRLRLIDQAGTVARAREIAARVGFEVDVTKLVGELTLADQTLVAVCRALADGARLIVLDEPTAYLEARQVRAVFALLSRLRDDGVACVLITHRSEDVLHICDRVTVLRNGRDIARREASELSEGELIQLITGRTVARAADPRPTAPADDGARPDVDDAAARVVLTADGLRAAPFGPVSFSVRAGEVVGVCGLADAGQFALGQALVGALPLTGGRLTIDGQPYRPGTMRDALGRGIGFVPADRARDGLATALSAVDNLLMNPRQPWWRPLRHSHDDARCRSLLDTFAVSPSDPDRDVATFSGGNQQKILLAKWLGRGDRRVVVLNEPSAGVDVGAKADIHDEIRRSCARDGTVALVISTDFQEIADLCDRALVMRRGAVVGEIRRADLHADVLTEMAYGGTI